MGGGAAALGTFRVQGAMGGDSFLTPDAPDSELTIDISEVTFASPAGIVALAAFVDKRFQGSGRVVELRRPRQGSTANYLSRAHVAEFLDEYGVHHDLLPVFENDLGRTHVPLTTFAGSQQIRDVALAAFEFAERTSPGSGDALHTAICEAGENVGYHAGRPIGFAVAQYFPTSGAFEFSIGDAGRGLLGSLADVGASTHAEAARLALKPGVSATREAGRGYGLSTIVAQLLELRGTVTLLSGDHALLKYDSDKEYGRALDGFVPGLIINARFRT